MEEQIMDATARLEADIIVERARIVRLCARYTGDAEAAEDLTQETLLEAWRHMNGLRDPEKRVQWLFGIARNVCLRWARKRGRDLAHIAEAHPDQEMQLEESLIDNLDVEVELERKELIELLDRSLALLPPETRIALVKHYVEESPLAEIAAQLGSNASAVAMRLQRGKLAMRKLLKDDLAQERSVYLVDGVGEWEQTSIWCPECGERRLLGIFLPERGWLRFKCPQCNSDPRDHFSNTDVPSLNLFTGIKGFKPAHKRAREFFSPRYTQLLNNSPIPCFQCGRPTVVKIWEAPYPLVRFLKEEEDHRVADYSCPQCDGENWSTLRHITYLQSEGWQFWREHPRMRTLPEQYVEAHGRPAIISTIESVTDSARLVVISDYETWQTLEIGGAR